MMITLKCDFCGAGFKAKPYRKKLTEHHFCNQSCYGHWQSIHRKGMGRTRITVQCHTCGVQIEKTPSQIRERNFCSRKCLGEWRSINSRGANNPAWKGGHVNCRGPNWIEQRKKALQRDGHKCCHCASTHTLRVHHKTPFHLFGHYLEANQPDNLITVCNVCHGVAEQAYYQEHPDARAMRMLPIVTGTGTCERCGAIFMPRSPRTAVCDACCTFSCANCGKKFYTRKIWDRAPKYCSRDCRNANVAPKRSRKINH